MEDINWDIVGDVSLSVAKRAVKLGYSNNLEEVQSEIIGYIFNGSHASNCLLQYCTGDDAPGKRNKLAYSLLTNKSWLRGIFNTGNGKHDYLEQTQAGYFPESGEGFTVTLYPGRHAGRDEVVGILKSYYTGDAIVDEASALIVDRLINLADKKQQALKLSYGDGVSVAEGGRLMGFSSQRFSFLRKQGLEELQKVIIPMFVSAGQVITGRSTI